LAGLENIGNKYAESRHNIGFEVADYLANQHDAELEISQLSELANFKQKGKSVYLL
jgi:PTH1 family peptidyl-tRNA hydrolase